MAVPREDWVNGQIPAASDLNTLARATHILAQDVDGGGAYKVMNALQLDTATGVVCRGGVSSTTPSAAKIDFYGGYARVIGAGPDASTNGAVQLVSVRSDGSNAIYALTVRSNGNIGIGTSAAGRALEVSAADTNSGIKITGTDSARSWLLGIGAVVGDGKFAIYDYGAPGTRLVIDTLGRVGINTTTPSYFLQVKVATNYNFGVNAAGTSVELRAVNDNNSAFVDMAFSASSYIFGGMPTANPGAGTKKLWCDTTAGNVVKFAV